MNIQLRENTLIIRPKIEIYSILNLNLFKLSKILIITKSDSHITNLYIYNRQNTWIIQTMAIKIKLRVYFCGFSW